MGIWPPGGGGLLPLWKDTNVCGKKVAEHQLCVISTYIKINIFQCMSTENKTFCSNKLDEVHFKDFIEFFVTLLHIHFTVPSKYPQRSSNCEYTGRVKLKIEHVKKSNVQIGEFLSGKW